ncbi:holo-[acyl-carrier-protein] synthase [Desulfovibrio sp.]
MIRGIGLDVVELARIRAALDRFGPRFAARILTPRELEQLPEADSVPRLAALFAAKEAAVKALGTGFAGGIGFQSLEIEHLPSGQPRLSLLGPALERARSLGADAAHVSLTHGRDTAAAVVVLESRE